MPGMSKEEFTKSILECPPYKPYDSPEEAYEAGRRGDLSKYDAAGKYCAKKIYYYFKEHPEQFNKVVRLYHGWKKLREEALSGKINTTIDFQEQYLKLLDECGFPRTFRYDSSLTIEYGKIHPDQDRDIESYEHMWGQDIVLMAMKVIDDAPEIKKVCDEVGPSGFMWSWAFNAAVRILDDEAQW